MRLIDADALLDGLEKLYRRRELNAAYNGYRGSFVTWNDAIYAIKDAPIVPQWIPCKDHLPLFDLSDVLLLYHDKRCGCEDDYYIVQAYTVRGQWRPALRIDDSDMDGLEPVAWMPLPALYKEGQE